MDSNIKTITLLLFIILVTKNDAARILAVFPVPSISHQVVFRQITQELTRRGHEVVVITTDPAYPKGKAPTNLTEVDIHDKSYETWVKEFVKHPQGRQEDWPSMARVAFKTLVDLFETQMGLDEVKNVIFDKTKTFDLLIVEACVSAALGVSHVHKVPVIQISSFGALPRDVRTVGAPLHLFLHPTSSQQRVGQLTMWEKVETLYLHYRLEKVFDEIDSQSDEILKRLFGAETPSISELRNNVHMLFLNVHPMWELNRPVPPNVVYMGGVHQKPAKDLPKELKSYLDSSKNGVIYISFGTNVDPSLLPHETIQAMINVLSKLPYDILWKWNNDELPGRTVNIKIAKWLPQSDMLRHPKIKLFITQAGLQSTDEAIAAGVPMIGVPMLGDQWYNAELYEYFKIGKRLDLDKITGDNLIDAIYTIIGDDSYRRNIAKLKTVLHDAPQMPLEKAIWWIEYLLRHRGANHLRSPSANITWTQYLELELVLYLCVVLASLIFSAVATICFICRNVRSAAKKPKIH